MAESTLVWLARSVLNHLASAAFKELHIPDLQRLEADIESISVILYSAEQRECNELAVKGWLSRLRAVLYDADDLFDAIAARTLHKNAMAGNTFMKEVRLFFSKSNQLRSISKTAHGVKAIRQRLDNITLRLNRFKFLGGLGTHDFVNPTSRSIFRPPTHHFVNEFDVIGRLQEKEDIIKLLLDLEYYTGDETSPRSVISIIGFGGLGKTTLAQLVYNDDRVKIHFELRLWACIDYLSDLNKILMTTLNPVTSFDFEHGYTLDQLQYKLREHIAGKIFLLVLDDVWDEDERKWDNVKPLLDWGARGSKILVTTRSTKVAHCSNAIKPFYHLSVLSEEKAWDLFVKATFEEGELESNSHLVPLGQQIVRRCGHVPLALTTVGGMLRYKLKNERTWLSVAQMELLEVFSDDNNGKIFQAFKDSYYHLPCSLKNCFAYCSLLPKDCIFDKDELVFLWQAQGFLKSSGNSKLEEDVGEEFFFYLVDRCFFQEVERYTKEGSYGFTCKMHNLLHEFATKVAGTESKCFGEKVLRNPDSRETLHHISFFKTDSLFDYSSLFSHSKGLRTLLFHDRQVQLSKNTLNSLLSSFKMLRTLQLSFLNITKLPNSLGELIHLRYLNLSYNSMLKFLPKSLCKLYHLLTLSLKGCECLEELPSNLGKLVSLRHLFLENCTSLTFLPSGFASLTSLMTLDRLIVHHHNGGLKFLERLDNLRGGLKIELPMEGWSNAEEDARKSNMLMKSELNGLTIKWTKSNASSAHEMAREKIEEVLEALKLHDYLQYLKIEGYVAETLPCRVFSLSRVKELILYNCAFEYLDDKATSDSSFFPSLKVLQMDSLPNLKGWWRDGAVESKPCISSVTEVVITNCPKLEESLPLFGGMEKLELSGVNEKLVKKLLIGNIDTDCSTSSFPSSSECHYSSRLKELKLVEIEDLSSLPEGWIRHLTALKTLRITNCSKLSCVSHGGLAHLTALEELHIIGCGDVVLVDEDSKEVEHDLKMPWKKLQKLRSLDVPWQSKQTVELDNEEIRD